MSHDTKKIDTVCNDAESHNVTGFTSEPGRVGSGCHVAGVNDCAVARSTPRSPLDFYPTPYAVSRVAADFLRLEATDLDPTDDSMLDPAAGRGDLIAGMRLAGFGEFFWHGIEIDPDHADALEFEADDAQLADALSIEWPAANIVANPPFSRLDAFWKRIASHRDKYGVWCLCFMPCAWWSAEKRSGYTRPDHVLQLGWRPRFRKKAGPAHKGSQDFVWAVLEPSPCPVSSWRRAEKPGDHPAAPLGVEVRP